jgi:hypothetical protein
MKDSNAPAETWLPTACLLAFAAEAAGRSLFDEARGRGL